MHPALQNYLVSLHFDLQTVELPLRKVLCGLDAAERDFDTGRTGVRPKQFDLTPYCCSGKAWANMMKAVLTSRSLLAEELIFLSSASASKWV